MKRCIVWSLSSFISISWAFTSAHTLPFRLDSTGVIIQVRDLWTVPSILNEARPRGFINLEFSCPLLCQTSPPDELLKSPELCGFACRRLCDRQEDDDSNVLPGTKTSSQVCSGINDPEVQMEPVHIVLMFSYFRSVPWAAGSLGGSLRYLS